MGDAEKKFGTWTPAKKEDKKALAQQPSNAATEKKSDPICPSSGCPEPKKKNGDYPVDYKVPDFGMDHDIKDSLKHMNDQEAEKGTWTLPRDKDGKIIGSFPSNNTLSSKPASKTALAVSADVQMKSDPICSSAGCTQYEHPKHETYPMDYPVPNFGVDHDIAASQAHTDQVEKSMGYTWNPDQDDDGKWIVPTEDADFKLAGTKADIHLESDPAFNSDEGYETRHSNPYKKGEQGEGVYYPMDVPFDHDIKASLESKEQAEETLGHKMDTDANVQLSMKTAVKTQAKAANKAQARSEMAQLRENMMSNWGLKN